MKNPLAPIVPPVLRLELVGVAFRTGGPDGTWHRASAILSYQDGDWGKPACAARPARVEWVADEPGADRCPDCYPQG